MKTLTSLCFSFFCCLALAAQKNDVTIDDLKLSSCAFEPEAPALKLLDLTENDFEIYSYGTKLKTEKKIRIKIFNENGYKYATVHIPYLNKRGLGKIKQLDGAVYTLSPDGKIMTERLEKKDFFRDKATDYVGLVSFTFPNLKPGCIVEFSYTTVENNMPHIYPWLIQDEIPVRNTINIITTPVEANVNERIFGLDTVSKVTELLRYNRFRKTTYFLKDVPSFKAEPYMSSVNDYMQRITFQLRPSIRDIFSMSSNEFAWKFAGSSLITSKFYTDQVNPVIPGTEKIIDSAKTIKSVKDRIAYIYKEVRDHFPGKSEQTLQFEDVKEAWKEKTATSAEMNIILVNLFEKTSIRSIPILISTRENGKIHKDFAGNGQLNGIDVIAFDSSRHFVLDASTKNLAVNNPPLNIMNRETFLLSKDSMQWIKIVDDRPLLKQTAFISTELNEDGKLEGTSNVQYFDYAKSLRLDTSITYSGKEFIDKKPAGLKILSSTTDAGNDDDPLFEAVEFEYQVNNSGDFYFLNPLLMLEKKKNPFLAEKRISDIDFGCNQLLVMNIQVKYPAAFTVEHLPKNLTIRAQDSSFFYQVSYNNTGNTVNVSQQFETKRAIFSPEEYEGLREFFKKMYALMSEEIILKKKS